MEIIKRTIQSNIEKKLFKGKIVIIYGARQVGKTTLIRQIQEKYEGESIYLNCDEPDIRQAFTHATSTAMKAFVGNKKIVFLDEAQRVEDIGISLKLLVDTYPNIQIVATGSSSFDLSNKIKEPLTGRAIEFYLYPFVIKELKQSFSDIEIDRILEQRILFGMYPEVTSLSQNEAKEHLKKIANNYLYKDALQYQNIKHPEILEKLLQALALQISNEVSYNELALTVGIDKKTVANYIQILEKAFIIFRLKPLHRNARKELTKLRKIYFYDTGIRNAIINNFNLLDLRQDRGSLWENFLISERVKQNYNYGKDIQNFFWRTLQQQKIDYVEEKNGQMSGFEFKLQDRRYRPPKFFLESYPNSSVKLVTKNNYKDFVLE